MNKKIILILAIFFLAGCAAQEKMSPANERRLTDNSISDKTENNNENEETVVGEAVTKIIDTGINRVSNINLACKSISGMMLLPGEEFSFNETTGKRSKENGYKDAPIIFHGEKSYGTGGGVCQVSSTIYMAVLNANLKVTERHSHSEAVAYAPGTDATVVYGEKDFKFRNNTEDTIYLYTWVQDEMVYAKIVKKEK